MNIEQGDDELDLSCENVGRVTPSPNWDSLLISSSCHFLHGGTARHDALAAVVPSQPSYFGSSKALVCSFPE
jgi:hypothetical protein